MHFFSSPVRRAQLWLVLSDTLAVTVAFVLAYAIKILGYDGKGIDALLGRMTPLFAIPIALHPLSLYVFELYDDEKRRTPALQVFWIAVAVLVAAGLSGVAFYLVRSLELGRVQVAIHVPLAVATITLFRSLLGRYRAPRTRRRITLVAPPGVADDLRRMLSGLAVIDYALADVVPVDERTGAVAASSEGTRDLARRVASSRSDLVVADVGAVSRELAQELLDLKSSGMRVLGLANFVGMASGKVPVAYVQAGEFLRTNAARFVVEGMQEKIKRLADVVVATVALVLASPVIVVVAALVKGTSPGPALFRQERLGRDEVPFTVLKFRTMVDEAEAKTGPRWATAGDARITPIGRFLRTTRLDELPQLVNVLRGDMSLVGPRPIRRHFADRLHADLPHYMLRFSVKPGLTGWAQVSCGYGASLEGQREKLEYDLYYILHQSFWFDCYILVKTVQTLLFRRGQ